MVYSWTIHGYEFQESRVYMFRRTGHPSLDKTVHFAQIFSWNEGM